MLRVKVATQGTTRWDYGNGDRGDVHFMYECKGGQVEVGGERW